MEAESNLLVHRIFNIKRDTGLDIVFTKGEDNEIRWKIADQSGHTVLFTPVNFKYDKLKQAVDHAHFTLRRISHKLDFNDPK